MLENSEAHITTLFDQWNEALKSKNPKQVVDLYANDGILLPTLSNRVRHNHEEIEEYFIHFLAKGPVGSIIESNIRVFNDLAINSGIYSFAFEDGSSAEARYTFVYRQVKGSWKIVEHHSSLLPE
ncbi:MAG: SgcJ/EcaC family oxidoreductase [Pontiellaceae bacterium]